MFSMPNDFALSAWKRQLDTTLQIMQVVIEGAEKAREIQLAAAVDAHASLAANRKALESVSNVADVSALQSKLFADSVGRMPHYWSSLAANARDSQMSILKLVLEGTAAGGWFNALPQGAAPKDTLNNMIDAAWTQWLEATRRLYAAPLGAAAAEKVA